MKFGLIGEHLGHSYSKLIQESMVQNYTYEIHELARDEVDTFMKAKEFEGINVTIPYKQTVIPYLDELDDTAKKIGAVNAVINRDGKLIGYNTDYSGFYYMLKHHNIEIKDKKVLIMGNGGASKAIQAVIKDMQASQILIVDIVLEDGIISIDDVYKKHSDVDVVVNTTPLGMYPKVDASSIELSKLSNVKACVDIVYNPFQTEFTLQAKKLGIVGVTGLEMLVAQAKYALEFFKDIHIDDSEITRVYKELLLSTTNIVAPCAFEVAQDVAKKLNKKVEVIQRDNLDAAIQSNMVLVVNDELLNDELIHHHLIRNGFIINMKDSDSIINEYNRLIETL